MADPVQDIGNIAKDNPLLTWLASSGLLVWLANRVPKWIDDWRARDNEKARQIDEQRKQELAEAQRREDRIQSLFDLNQKGHEETLVWVEKAMNLQAAEIAQLKDRIEDYRERERKLESELQKMREDHYPMWGKINEQRDMIAQIPKLIAQQVGQHIPAYKEPFSVD